MQNCIADFIRKCYYYADTEFKGADADDIDDLAIMQVLQKFF